MKECCGTCQYHTCNSGEWCCDNNDSECYGVETSYNDVCSDYEERN